MSEACCSHEASEYTHETVTHSRILFGSDQQNRKVGLPVFTIVTWGPSGR